MSRHRMVRNWDVDGDITEYDDYGHSVEEDNCLVPASPSTEQFMFRRGDAGKAATFSDYIREREIPEEVEEENGYYDEGSSYHEGFQLDDMDGIPDKHEAPVPGKSPSEVVDAYPNSTIAQVPSATNDNLSGDAAATDAPLPQRQRRERKRRPEVKPSNGPQAAGFGPDSSSASDIISAGDQPETVPKSRTPAQDKFAELADILSDSSIADGLSTGPISSNEALHVTTPPGHPTVADLSTPSSTARSRSRSPACFSSSSKPEEPAVRAPISLPEGEKELINLVVIGHVDAGKSTLMGHLLYQLGSVNQRTMHKNKQDSQRLGKGSFAYAWVLDETEEERERGVTMDIAQTKFETLNKTVVLLDAPGHRDFIPNMITGAAQADAALLVINATRGEFETGFDQGGQTREHTMLIRSLGVSQLAVVINKLDTVDWSKDRYDEVVAKLSHFLKTAGFGDARFVPASGLNGDNLISKVGKDHVLGNWYDGPCLLDVIDSFAGAVRPVEHPLRFCISDVFKSIGSGFSVSGKVVTGAVSVGDRIAIAPNDDQARIKGIQTEDTADLSVAYAGDRCLLSLTGIDITNVGPGMVITHPESRLKASCSFQARIVVFGVTVPITNGYPVVVHSQSVSEPAIVSRLLAQLHKGTGKVTKLKPRCLTKNSSGVVEVKTDRPMCLEVYSQCKQLGRITLRSGGRTLAAGTVMKIIEK